MNHVRFQLWASGALTLVALTVGCLAILLQPPRRLSDGSHTDGYPLIPQLGDEEPQALALTRGSETVQFIRQRDAAGAPSWRLGTASSQLGDDSTIGAAIGALRDLRVLRPHALEQPDSAADLAATGLDHPRCIWQLGFHDRQVVLRFGARALGFRGGVFVSISSQDTAAPATYVVNTTSPPLDEFDVNQLLDMHLIQRFIGDVRAIAFSTQKGDVRLHLDEKRGHWFETTFPNVRADPQHVEQLLSALSSLRAGQVVKSGVGSLEAQTIPENSIRLVLKLCQSCRRTRTADSRAVRRTNRTRRCENQWHSQYFCLR